MAKVGEKKNKWGKAFFMQGILRTGGKKSKAVYSIQDANQIGSRCCECGTYDCCNGVYSRYDVETGEWLGCFIRAGVEECHECSEAHRLADEAKDALKNK